jgi:hypothetical protein
MKSLPNIVLLHGALMVSHPDDVLNLIITAASAVTA